MAKELDDTGRRHHTREHTWRERIHQTAMIVFVVNVLVLMVFVGGWLSGWFHVSAGQGEADGQFRFQLAVNTSEFADDVQNAVEETQKATETIETVTELSTATGKVIDNDVAGHSLTIADKDSGQVKVKVNEVTEVKLDGEKASMNQIQAGDKVQVVFREKSGENFALKIQRLQQQ